MCIKIAYIVLKLHESLTRSCRPERWSNSRKHESQALSANVSTDSSMSHSFPTGVDYWFLWSHLPFWIWQYYKRWRRWSSGSWWNLDIEKFSLFRTRSKIRNPKRAVWAPLGRRSLRLAAAVGYYPQATAVTHPAATTRGNVPTRYNSVKKIQKYLPTKIYMVKFTRYAR